MSPSVEIKQLFRSFYLWLFLVGGAGEGGVVQKTPMLGVFGAKRNNKNEIYLRNKNWWVEAKK